MEDDPAAEHVRAGVPSIQICVWSCAPGEDAVSYISMGKSHGNIEVEVEGHWKEWTVVGLVIQIQDK